MADFETQCGFKLHVKPGSNRLRTSYFRANIFADDVCSYSQSTMYVLDHTMTSSSFKSLGIFVINKFFLLQQGR